MPFLTRPRAYTFAVALAGAALFLWIGAPLPFLLGPMAACLLAALLRAPLSAMGEVGILFRTFLGVAVGSTITPDLMHDLPHYAATLALIPLFVAVIGGVGYLFLRRIMKFDPPTAFYSAMPGGLQDMLIFGEEAGGDVRAMSLIHATRVLVIVALTPIAFTLLYGTDLSRPPSAPASALPLHEIAIMLAAGVIGWKGAQRVGLFGASILGPMIVTAALSLAGVIQHRPPAEMILASQFFIGIAVGAKYAGITARELRVDVTAGLAFSLLLSGISLVFVLAVRHISPAGELDILLAFLPGGQAELAIIAIAAGADVAFVVAHHILRMIVVLVAAPLVGRRTNPRPRR